MAEETPDATETEQPADDGDSLVVLEWVGGITAAISFFLTPLVPGPVAFYCALKIRREKPRAARGIFIVLGVTVLVWLFMVPFVIL